MTQPQLWLPHAAAKQLEAKPAGQGIGTHLLGFRVGSTTGQVHRDTTVAGVRGVSGMYFLSVSTFVTVA